MGTNADLQRILRIKEHCEEISEAVSQNNYEVFINTILKNGIAMSVLQIGELIKGLTADFILKNEEISWKLWIRNRDLFAHSYHKVDYEILWQTALNDVPILLDFCNKILGE
jgi:uncharacterized protein with HEPN domain